MKGKNIAEALVGLVAVFIGVCLVWFVGYLGAPYTHLLPGITDEITRESDVLFRGLKSGVLIMISCMLMMCSIALIAIIFNDIRGLGRAILNHRRNVNG